MPEGQRVFWSLPYALRLEASTPYVAGKRTAPESPLNQPSLAHSTDCNGSLSS